VREAEETYIDDSASERATIITARGTGDGLVLRIDGRVAPASLREALRDFLASRRRFLSGNGVALEWVGAEPDPSFVDEVKEIILTDFDIKVSSSRLREPRVDRAVVDETSVVPAKKPTLFDGMEALPLDEVTPQERADMAVDSRIWDDPNARVIYATLRSGQRIETEHTLVIFGDVNSGAEVIAGGDIVVLGTLRGIAHAGAYDTSARGRFIFALALQPTQLRIGTVITRGGSSENRSRGAEVARVDGPHIVVEPYAPRMIQQKGPRAAPEPVRT
jgi:septum site-determining protein MinC